MVIATTSCCGIRHGVHWARCSIVSPTRTQCAGCGVLLTRVVSRTQCDGGVVLVWWCGAVWCGANSIELLVVGNSAPYVSGQGAGACTAALLSRNFLGRSFYATAAGCLLIDRSPLFIMPRDRSLWLPCPVLATSFSILFFCFCLCGMPLATQCLRMQHWRALMQRLPCAHHAMC